MATEVVTKVRSSAYHAKQYDDNRLLIYIQC